MSGPSAEAGGLPAWPDWTWPEVERIAKLHRANYGVVPDHIQAHLDALDRAEQDREPDDDDPVPGEHWGGGEHHDDQCQCTGRHMEGNQ